MGLSGDLTSAVASAGLTKRYGSQTVVDAIDLDVPAGAVYGFLGPNGSGKTTTIRMLLGLVRPTGGEIALLGAPMPGGRQAVLPRVGALVEGPAFHPYLSGQAEPGTAGRRRQRTPTRAPPDSGSTPRSTGWVWLAAAQALPRVLAGHAAAARDRRRAPARPATC